jgi:hypothetical protein
MILGLSESLGFRKLKWQQDSQKGKTLENNQEACKKNRSTAQVEQILTH